MFIRVCAYLHTTGLVPLSTNGFGPTMRLKRLKRRMQTNHSDPVTIMGLLGFSSFMLKRTLPYSFASRNRG